ncbi:MULTISPECIES: GntR family transcriptional regulator [unclassified Variovorax]|uniref:GntR family transcriptional regulator n=1 Tax=unclassified Variovorax TaxID=663243 RepID=UPI003F47C836
MASSSEIAQRILHSVLAGKLGAGDRLGEQPLATLFDCSRTVVREALTELAVRGLVASSARRGWYVVELTAEQARQAFEAREVIETSVLRRIKAVSPAMVKRLRAHVERQAESIRDDDAGLRSFLLGDFHVCLADCLGNAMLSEALRDLTARTMLVAMRHQSQREATRSCAEHTQIVEALEAGDIVLAEQRLGEHLGSWDSKLRVPASSDDPLDQLRQALKPVQPIASTTTPPCERAMPARSPSSPKRARTLSTLTGKLS